MCINSAIGAFALSCKNKRAVLTVEAAFVVPLFLMMMLSIVSFMSLNYLDVKIDSAIYEELGITARNMHDSNEYGINIIGENVISRINNGGNACRLISGGANGIDFSSSDVTDDEIVRICADYKVKLLFDPISSDGIQRENLIVMHGFTGYNRGLDCYDDEYVYMTENGNVFHRSKDCSHIALSISTVSGNEIKKLRNENGGKYKRCEYCKPLLSAEKLYITSDGDRYHNTLMCSGLKRSVRRVRKSDIEGVRPCSRCGY